MKDKNEKRKDLDDLKKAIEEHKNIFVTSYEKLTVSQDFQLRKTVREAGGEYRVVKNNLAAKASEGTPANDLLGQLRRTCCQPAMHIFGRHPSHKQRRRAQRSRAFVFGNDNIRCSCRAAKPDVKGS